MKGGRRLRGNDKYKFTSDARAIDLHMLRRTFPSVGTSNMSLYLYFATRANTQPTDIFLQHTPTSTIASIASHHPHQLMRNQ